MLEVADVFRLHGAAYREQFGETLSSVQKQTLRDIAACRTPFFGGHVYQCDHCQQNVFAFHSCGNRSCPKCHQNQTERWLEKQRGHLLPCSYFLVTFTLPAELRPLARSHPKKIYSLLMKAAADALQKLAKDPRYLGARIGALSVLHTWTRAMLFHPHVHMLVTAGGLSSDHSSWIEPKHRQFLVPVEALSVIFQNLCGIEKGGIARRCTTVTVEEKLGRSLSACRPRRKGPGLSRPLRLPKRHHQQPIGIHRQHHRSIPVSRQQDSADPPCLSARRGVHRPIPPACPASRLRQSALLRNLESLLPQTTRPHSETDPCPTVTFAFDCPCTIHRSPPGHTPDSLSPLSHRSPRPCRNAASKSEPFSMMPHPLARPKLAPILALLIARSSTRVFPCRVPSPFRNLSTLILSDSFPVRCPSTPIQNFRPP